MHLADARETEAFGARLADALVAAAANARAAGEDLPEGAIRGLVFLAGPLGAGKTTLARGLVLRLGFEGPVKSPTYTVVEPYVRGERRVYHFDLYRLADPAELELIGARDYFAGAALCLVEWPERAAGWLPAPDLGLALAVEGAGRRLRIEPGSALGRAVADALGAE